jgi:hypothetical protein
MRRWPLHGQREVVVGRLRVCCPIRMNGAVCVVQKAGPIFFISPVGNGRPPACASPFWAVMQDVAFEMRDGRVSLFTLCSSRLWIVHVVGIRFSQGAFDRQNRHRIRVIDYHLLLNVIPFKLRAFHETHIRGKSQSPPQQLCQEK